MRRQIRDDAAESFRFEPIDATLERFETPIVIDHPTLQARVGYSVHGPYLFESAIQLHPEPSASPFESTPSATVSIFESRPSIST